jgi:hypothetical protein
MRWGDHRRARRAQADQESRARLLAMMRQALHETDESIANEKQAIAENTDFEHGRVQLPSPAFLFSVNNRPHIVEVISLLEQGASLRDVNEKIQSMAEGVKVWNSTRKRYEASH